MFEWIENITLALIQLSHHEDVKIYSPEMTLKLIRYLTLLVPELAVVSLTLSRDGDKSSKSAIAI